MMPIIFQVVTNMHSFKFWDYSRKTGIQAELDGSQMREDTNYAFARGNKWKAFTVFRLMVLINITLLYVRTMLSTYIDVSSQY